MKKIKILTILIAVVAVTMISILGIYVPKQNRMENIVKNYEYGMNLKGGRVISIKPDTSNKTTIKDSNGKEVEDASSLSDDELKEKGYTKEETPYNSSDVLTKENYEKTKKIIEKRLKELKVEDYEIKLDDQSGNMNITIPENDDTDTVVTNLETVGKFELVDSDTNELLMDNNDIKRVRVMYGSNQSSSMTSNAGTSVYLDIEFNKNGTKKFEDVTEKYKNTTNNTNTENSSNTATDNTTENATDTTTDNSTNTTNTTDGSSESKETAKKVTMKIDDETIMSTAFDEKLSTGSLQLTVGSGSTDEKTLKNYVTQAQGMATVLDTGNMPVKYTVENNEYILSDITKDNVKIVFYVMIGVVALSVIYLIIKYKSFGLVQGIASVGVYALLLLILRYANVEITIESIIGMIISVILNYMFVYKLLSKTKGKDLDKEQINKFMKETYKEYFVKLIPVIIIIVAFTFSGFAPLSSLGMTMFWGISLIAVYNAIVNNFLLRTQARK